MGLRIRVVGVGSILKNFVKNYEEKFGTAHLQSNKTDVTGKISAMLMYMSCKKVKAVYYRENAQISK
jgi:hypothetical protein